MSRIENIKLVNDQRPEMTHSEYVKYRKHLCDKITEAINREDKLYLVSDFVGADVPYIRNSDIIGTIKECNIRKTEICLTVDIPNIRIPQFNILESLYEVLSIGRVGDNGREIHNVICIINLDSLKLRRGFK